MERLISLQAAIDAGLRLCGRDTKMELINLCEASIADSEGRAGAILDYIGELEDLPSAQPEVKTNVNGDWVILNKDKILKEGMEGREVDFRIGGRLFAIREKAQ